jgi:integrase
MLTPNVLAAETDALTKTKAMPNRVNFTAFALKRLPLPSYGNLPSYGKGKDGRPVVRQITFWDSTVAGFGLRVSSTGTKTWIMMYRTLRKGKKELDRYAIGPYAERDGEGLTLAMARQRAHELRQVVDAGGDPMRMKVDAKAEALKRSQNTFGALAQTFLDDYASRLRPKTQKQYEGLLLGRDCTALHPMPLMEIGRRDIIAVLDGITKRGVTVTANRALAAMQSFFGWAIQKGYIDQVPTDHIKRPCEEKPRHRHLYGSHEHGRPSELALAWKAFEQCGEAGALPQLLLLLGQRRDEVARMEWTELLDLDGPDARWVIPSARTKNKKEHVVPLGKLAVQVIKSLTRYDGCKYVFTSDARTPRSGFSRLKRAVDTQIEAIKEKDPERYVGQCVEPWVFHSLRHTFKTGLAELGVSLEIRDLVMNHSKQGMNKIYDHAHQGPAKRAAMETWERHLDSLKRDGLETSGGTCDRTKFDENGDLA